MLKHYLDPFGPINPEPTQFADLNDLLVDLTEQARAILADNFAGAYLQGSFAIGDADIHSDCDFLIPVNGRIHSKQEEGLRRLHDEIPTRPGHWPKDLEGSYPHRAELGSLAGLGVPWLHVNHGHREMVWSTHCNTEVVRWSLWERGVTLVGPEPRSILGEVPADAVRAQARRELPELMANIVSWTDFSVAWSQRFAVATYCRMLYSLQTGRVTSKQGALHWAADALDPCWRPLLTQVLEDRSRGFDRADVARNVGLTLDFARYAESFVLAPTPAARDTCRRTGAHPDDRSRRL